MTDPPNMHRSLSEMAETDAHGMTAAEGDAELIARSRLGDAGAYGVLYQRHAPAARRLATQLVTRAADVDDVVAETFARVLSAMVSGNGPVEAFRPYLLTALRRVAVDQIRRQRKQVPTDNTELPDQGEPFDDPVIADLDRSLVAQAFRSLPERWSAVLWHTEVEESRPAEVAELLGLSANAVAALRYRAREGLRQAYLQSHLSSPIPPGCRPVAGNLGAYVRGRLARRQAREVDRHLRECSLCASACADLKSVNDSLRGLLAPVILGTAATGYLADAGHSASHGTWLAGLRAALHRLAGLLAHRPVVPLTAAVAAASLAVPAFTFIHAPARHQAGPPVTAITRGGQPRSTAPGPAGATPQTAPKPAPRPVTSAAPASSHSARPTPSGSPSPSPTASPSPSASPTSGPTLIPTPRATVKVTAKLGVTVQVGSALDLGLTVGVSIAVSDPGTAATGPLTTSLTLPPGISVLALPGSPWSCTTSSGTMTCTHAAIGAGATAEESVSVLVLSLSGCGDSLAATVVSGSLSAAGSSAEQVQCAAPLL